MVSLKRLSFITLLACAGPFFWAQTAAAAGYVFPVLGSSSYSNDYRSYRGNTYNGRHNAIDIIASKHQPIVAAVAGKIIYVTYPEPYWGNAVIIQSSGGYCYWYLHINNDDKGTDNGKGGAMKAFAPDVNDGNPVKAGQLLGWVGDSGSSEDTVSHLHFEVLKAVNGECDLSGQGKTHINPYDALNDARHISRPASYQLPGEILPFGSTYKGKVNVSRGNLQGDTTDEVVVGAGYGGGPRVNIYNSADQLITGFYAFDKSLRYGVDTAVGDVDGDGKNDIVAVARTADGPMVAIYKYTAGVNGAAPKIEKQTSFKAFTAGSNNSPRVAVGNIDGLGASEIIVGAGTGRLPMVNVFKADGSLVKTLQPYASSFTGGVDVAVGNISGTAAEEIIVSPLTEASSRVQIFDGLTYAKLREFYAYGSSYRGGTWLSAGNVVTGSTAEEIVTVPHGGGPKVSVFNGQGSLLQSRYYMEEWWRGYYDIAAGTGNYTTSTGGNRRGSVR